MTSCSFPTWFSGSLGTDTEALRTEGSFSQVQRPVKSSASDGHLCSFSQMMWGDLGLGKEFFSECCSVDSLSYSQFHVIQSAKELKQNKREREGWREGGGRERERLTDWLKRERGRESILGMEGGMKYVNDLERVLRFSLHYLNAMKIEDFF